MTAPKPAPATVVSERGGQLILDTPMPGVLRVLFLLTLLLGALMFVLSLGPMIGAVQWIFDFDLQSALLALSAGWAYWILAALVLLIAGMLRMDHRLVRRAVWDAGQLRVSWVLGSLEFFVRHFPRSGDSLEVVAAQHLAAAGAAQTGDENSGSWRLIWRSATGAPKAGQEIARYQDKADADALLQRLSHWSAAPPSSIGRRAATQSSATADLANIVTHWLLRLPIYILLGGCLMLVVMAAEGLLSKMGLMTPQPLWDRTAEIRQHHVEWRLVSETRISGLSQAASDPQYEEITTVLNYAVEIEDADAGLQWRRVAVPSPNYSEAHNIPDRGDDLRRLLPSTATAGLVPERPSFAIPRRLLDIELDESGVLRFDRLSFDAAAVGRLSTIRSAFYNIVAAIDAPEHILPILWTESTLNSPQRVVYRKGSASLQPVWRESDVQLDPGGLAFLGGFGAFFGALGIFLGISIVAVLAALDGKLWAGRSPLSFLRYQAIWLALCASTLVWVPLAPGMTKVLGIDDLLLDRMRLHLVGICCLLEPQALPVERELIRGHWAPDGSRHRQWLEELDLLTPPTQRYPDLAAARLALNEHIRARLTAMDWPARRRFLARYLPNRLAENGSSMLNDQVIAPLICPWRHAPEAAEEHMEIYAVVFEVAKCR